MVEMRNGGSRDNSIVGTKEMSTGFLGDLTVEDAQELPHSAEGMQAITDNPRPQETTQEIEEGRLTETYTNHRPWETTDNQLICKLFIESLNEYKFIFKNLLDSVDNPKDKKIRLQNVGNSEENHFKPKQLSIGPIHADDPKLFKKELKYKLAAHFFKGIQGSGDLLKKLQEDAESIKIYFDVKVITSYTDDELIRLLFLDGSATLGFIDCYVNKRLDMLDISCAQSALIQNDLFSLENQIPFKVLCIMMGFRSEEENIKLKNDFCRFIALMSTFEGDFTELIVMDLIDKQGPVHILDLLRQVQFGDTVFSYPCGYRLLNPIRYIFRHLNRAVAPISVLMKQLSKSQSLPTNQRKIKQYPFRNVQELKKAGIDFKPTDSLTSISFHSSLFVTAQLKLPILVVDNSTEHKLLNLVGFEMCSDERPWVTSYIHLLDLLIDSKEDVKDLKEADILRNCLDSDAKVADFINSMGSNTVVPNRDTYEDVKNKIEVHYTSRSRRRWSIWMTQVRRTHFSSPWTVLALFAATAVIGLTVIQTYYAINPKK